jgi:hypothetical protein
LQSEIDSGLLLGLSVAGLAVGERLGFAVGLAVGLSVGDRLGLAVGLAVGLSVGD